MALSDLEERVIDFMGEMRARVLNLENSMRVQGERLGYLERDFNAHEKEFANLPVKNGKKEKVVYVGIGGGIVTLIDVIRGLL